MNSNADAMDSSSKKMQSKDKKFQLKEQYEINKLKMTNVMFMYNGHNWDAYEVLNLRPGASIDQIRTAFNSAIKKEDPSTHDFLKTALEALLTNIRDHG